MPRSVKLLVGAATAAPLVLAAYLLFRMIDLLRGIVQRGGNVSPDTLADWIPGALAVPIAAAVLTTLLLAFYIWHLITRRNQARGELHVPIWLLVFVLLPMFAMPVYWFCHVWPEPDTAGARV